MDTYVKSEIDQDGIARIIFGNPPHNAMTADMLQKLAALIGEASADTSVKVLLIKSAGDRAFCAGASFDELMKVQNLDEGKAFFSGFANVINACRKCKKIIVGRVQGKAVGGGVGLAAAFDYCSATQYAAIKLSEISIGIGPFVIGPAVTRKLGVSAFSQLSLDPNNFQSSSWAKEQGLFAEVYDTVDDLDEVLEAQLQTLAKANPEALTILKKTLWAGTDNWDELLSQKAAESGRLVLSEFTQKALAKFK